MTAEEQLQRRQVRALERIADALESITGDIGENHVSTPEARLHAVPDRDPEPADQDADARPEPMGADDM